MPAQAEAQPVAREHEPDEEPLIDARQIERDFRRLLDQGVDEGIARLTALGAALLALRS